MPRTLPRRKRLVLMTAAAAGLFAVAATVILVVVLRDTEVYRPGEDIQGLTAELARNLPPDYPRVTFEDVTQKAGITFHHFSGRRSAQLPEDMGSGVAWGDYNNDGWQDLYVVNAPGPLTLTSAELAASPARSTLYRNNGDGTFTDLTDETGARFTGWGMAAAWADTDNDGWLDLFISAYGFNVFYHNNGDGTFTDRSVPAGLGADSGFWAGVAWGDYDRDGFVDLYVTGYTRYSSASLGLVSKHYDVDEPVSLNPSSFASERNLLYHNNGDGTFTETATPAGVLNPQGRGLEAVWTDFDEDGWPDLYVANDVSDNVLFRNLGNGTFTDISHAARVADYRGAMGIAVGDWDGDTDIDMMVTHWIAQENALYSNRLANRTGDGPGPGLFFMDEADRFGLGQIALDYIGWGTAFVDYDNDGWLDLFVANGSTLQDREKSHLLTPMRDLLFWNRGPDEGFFDVSPVSGPHFARELVGRGAAFADFDNDGDQDVFIVNNGGPGVLLENTGGNRANWLQVHLEGSTSNRAAIGAKLRLFAGGGSQVRLVGAQGSYLSQNALLPHFGLGALGRVDSLTITWPSGTHQVLTDIAVNQILEVREPDRE